MPKFTKKYESDINYLHDKVCKLEAKMFNIGLFFFIVKFIILIILFSGALLYIVSGLGTVMVEWPEMGYAICITFGLVCSLILMRGELDA